MRKVALALMKKGDKYLVEKFFDDLAGVYFYKLIGGGIEDGEDPSSALIRELKEELKSDIEVLGVYSVINDDFEYKKINRKIEAHILNARFVNEDDCRFAQKFIYSPEGKFLSIAMWKTLKEIKEEGLCLYPRPLLMRLEID